LSNSECVLLDAGEATQHQSMRARSVSLSKITSILITHLHGDHCFGLFGLLSTMAMHQAGAVPSPADVAQQKAATTAAESAAAASSAAAAASSTTSPAAVPPEQAAFRPTGKPILLVGPVGLRAMVVSVLSLSGGFSAVPLHFLELTPEQSYPDLGLISGGLRLSAYPLTHRLPAFAYVLREADRPGALLVERAKAAGALGRQLAQLKSGLDVTLADDANTILRSADFVGPSQRGRTLALLQDTAESSRALEGVRGADLLIHECTYSGALADKARQHGHSTSSMAGQFAAEAGARMLVLTHFSSRYETREQTTKKAKLASELQAKAAESVAAAATSSGKANKTADKKKAAAAGAASNPSSSASNAAASVVAAAAASASPPVEQLSSLSLAAPPPPSVAASSSAPSLAVEAMTMDELEAEALAAFKAATADGLGPPGGVHAAEDFTVLDSKGDDFVLRAEKDCWTPDQLL
jgi:ribonuclease Z